MACYDLYVGSDALGSRPRKLSYRATLRRNLGQEQVSPLAHILCTSVTCVRVHIACYHVHRPLVCT